jgi:hypothetical protein
VCAEFFEHLHHQIVSQRSGRLVSVKHNPNSARLCDTDINAKYSPFTFLFSEVHHRNVRWGVNNDTDKIELDGS